MQESHRKGVAHHPDPESYGGRREGAVEALTGVHTDQVYSCEIKPTGAPTRFAHAEGNMASGVWREPLTGPAQSKTLRMCGNSLRENREIP
jgi:hypothetical protein